jgi:hypothetical protein
MKVITQVAENSSFQCFYSESDMMKERFAKLLLGEDMSGAGNGVSSALALSNAITNLAGKYFFPNLLDH